MTIYLYNDDGVSQDGIVHMQHTFSALFINRYKIALISAQQVRSTPWQSDAVLFVIGGGRDIPYHNKLKGEANQKIKQFVQSGGAFLGICAGAYYASASFSFAANTPQAIQATRELGFFPGRSVGPLEAHYLLRKGSTSPYRYLFFKEKRAPLPLFYKEGGYFESANPHEIIASYDSSHRYPAILFRTFGQGKVLLSGIHFEYNTQGLVAIGPQAHRVPKRISAHEKKRLRFVEKILNTTLGMVQSSGFNDDAKNQIFRAVCV